VLRHAPGADARVEVAYRPAALDLRIVNGPPNRPPPATSRPGHGLVGMRERAAMLGGELTAEPQPDGGYAVTATLPLTEPLTDGGHP
jgi:signal transduction histidine kinase